mgnify:CR=1 FL=1
MADDIRDEDPFELGVTGFVQSPRPELSADAVVVDNNDDPASFFVQQGDFRYIRRDTRYFDRDYRYANSGGNNTARWTITGLTAGTTYQVAASWAGGVNRATNAPFSIDHAAAGGPTVVPVNQMPNPDDFEDFFTALSKRGPEAAPDFITIDGGEGSDTIVGGGGGLESIEGGKSDDSRVGG